MKRKIYFRADGNVQIGLGHITRMLALVDILKEEFFCYFIIQEPLLALQKQILEACDGIIILPYTSDLDTEVLFLIENHLNKDDIIVIDGYHFDVSYQQKVQQIGCKVACIDDIQHTSYTAEVVINHALGLSTSMFSKTPSTVLCLGVDYALLRTPFLVAATQKRTITCIETIFVCFGGADLNNLSLKILQLFSTFKKKKYSINMVLGGTEKNKAQVKNFANSLDCLTIHLYENLNASEMVEVMKNSDAAIVPGSSIMYEVLAVKMPIIGGYYVDNQKNIYEGFHKAGVIKGIGDLNKFEDYEAILNKFDPEMSTIIIDKQEKLHIKNVKNNFLNIFKQLENKNSLKIRRANKSDLMTYFSWANDFVVRENSVNKNRITLENHTKWYKSHLNSDNTIFYIFEQPNNNKPVGQLRFDLDNKEAIINYSIGAKSRGKGYGKIILLKAIKMLLQEKEHIHLITGIVKHTNIPSAKIFEKLGFSRAFDKKIGKELYYSYFLNVSEKNRDTKAIK